MSKAMIKQKADKATLKIGEVSRLSGIGIEALRFYERQGLLGQPARTVSGYRLYSRDVLDRLDFIKRAQVLGFSLAEIAQIIAEKQSGQNPCRHVREIVRQRLRETEERIKEMRRHQRALAATLEEWDEAGDRPGHICGLIESASVDPSAPARQKFRKR
jgi:DNA-binding transcriptional MerR regulator